MARTLGTWCRAAGNELEDAWQSGRRLLDHFASKLLLEEDEVEYERQDGKAGLEYANNVCRILTRLDDDEVKSIDDEMDDVVGLLSAVFRVLDEDALAIIECDLGVDSFLIATVKICERFEGPLLARRMAARFSAEELATMVETMNRRLGAKEPEMCATFGSFCEAVRTLVAKVEAAGVPDRFCDALTGKVMARLIG